MPENIAQLPPALPAGGGKALLVVLAVKIVVTALLWALPLVFFPAWGFAAFGIPVPEPMIFARLLGLAYVSLLVGYGWGFLRLKLGEQIDGIVWMGIVSNAGASLAIVIAALVGSFEAWPMLGKIYMGTSAALTSAIAAALAATRIRKVS